MFHVWQLCLHLLAMHIINKKPERVSEREARDEKGDRASSVADRFLQIDWRPPRYEGDEKKMAITAFCKGTWRRGTTREGHGCVEQGRAKNTMAGHQPIVWSRALVPLGIATTRFADPLGPETPPPPPPTSHSHGWPPLAAKIMFPLCPLSIHVFPSTSLGRR